MRPAWTWAPVAVTVAAILGYETYVVLNSFNIPILDDFKAILVAFGRWREQPSFALLLERHNEHWIAFTRLATMAQKAVTGEINIRALQILAALARLIHDGQSTRLADVA